jgi:multidrug efflux pump subunit AcrB
MGLVRFALKNIHAVLVLALLIIVLGVVALQSIPVDILPSFKAPAVQVLTYFNGMPARSVERTITDRVERWVNQSPGVRQVESRSIQGVSVVRLYFRDDVDPTAALTMTNSLALGTLPALPPNTLPPVVLPFDPTGTLPLGILTVSNPEQGEATVKDLARVEVRNALGKVPGCVAPTVIGGKDRQVMLYLDPKKLEARGLAPVDVVRALDEGNLMATPGTAYFGEDQVALDTNVMMREVEDFNDLPLRISPTQQIILSDIGHAEDANVIQKSRVRVNGRQQVFIPVYRQGGASSLAVVAGLKDEIPRIEQDLPKGTKLDFVIDQTESVRQSIGTLIHEGAVGAALVALMILVFLGNGRMTLIAVLALPLAILCGIIGLSATGNTINLMTLAGLFLAIGPLVDNAIVVLENTHRHRTLGKSAARAAFDGAGELTLPVLVATTATIIVLAPIALMPGLGGFLFKPLALAVGFAMVASFLLAWTLVPALCSKLLKVHHHSPPHPPAPSPTEARGGERHREFSDTREDPQAPAPPSPLVGEGGRGGEGIFSRLSAGIQNFLAALTRRYESLLNMALRARWLVLLAVALLFAGSLLLLRGIGQEFFPQVDAGQITLYVRAPSNLRLDAAERRVIEMEEFIQEQVPEAERRMIVSEIGLNPDWSSAYTANAGQQDAVIRVQLTDERRFTSQEYAVRLRHALEDDPRFVDLQVSFDTGGMVSAALNFGASSPIDIQIDGGQPEQRIRLARLIRDRVASVPGAADVHVHQRDDSPYLILKVKRQEAAAVGLSTRDVAMQVVTAMNSSIALTRNFWIDSKSGNQYFVAVQYPEDSNFRLDDLKNVMATGTRQATPVPLGTLVDLEPSTADVELNHVALRRITNVLVNTEGRDIGGLAGDIDGVIHQLREEGAVPEGVRVEMRGEFARMQESFRSLGGGLALASILVFLMMAPLFRSFLSPLIIMFTVPLGLIGVLTTLYLTGTTLNVQSEMGVIFLVGIVVSNGVLLIDFANKLRHRGVPVRDAIRRAATIRLRPILMTFLATTLGLLPMAIGGSRGSEAITPLARAVVGGLVTSTALTLFVVPILYTLLIRDRRRVAHDIDVELNARHDEPHGEFGSVGQAAHGD